MATISETLSRLKKSDFRAKFHLTARDRKYIEERGIETIKNTRKGVCPY